MRCALPAKFVAIIAALHIPSSYCAVALRGCVTWSRDPENQNGPVRNSRYKNCGLHSLLRNFSKGQAQQELGLMRQYWLICMSEKPPQGGLSSFQTTDSAVA